MSVLIMNLHKLCLRFYQDKEAMTFLAGVGPDALINTFVVNIKNEDGSLNTDINIANDLQSEIFKELSGRVGLPTKRIPMYLTTSEFNTKKYGVSLDEFKERLGVCTCFHYLC